MVIWTCDILNCSQVTSLLGALLPDITLIEQLIFSNCQYSENAIDLNDKTATFLDAKQDVKHCLNESRVDCSIVYLRGRINLLVFWCTQFVHQVFGNMNSAESRLLCEICGKNSTLRCSRCHEKYCSQDCQVSPEPPSAHVSPLRAQCGCCRGWLGRKVTQTNARQHHRPVRDVRRPWTPLGVSCSLST